MVCIGKVLMILFLVSITIVAVDIKAIDQSSIDAQIEYIKNADPLKRRELMNRFKEQLATMNRKERVEALRKLLGKMHVKNGNKVMNQLVHKPSNGADLSRQTGNRNSVHHMPKQPMRGGDMQTGHQHR